jgi:hypothetical protein
VPGLTDHQMRIHTSGDFERKAAARLPSHPNFGSLRGLSPGGLEQFFQCNHNHAASDEGHYKRQDE